MPPSWAPRTTAGWRESCRAGCWGSPTKTPRRHWCDSVHVSPWKGAAERPTVCWDGGTPVLPGGGRAALRVPRAPLPPKEGLSPPAQPPPAALRDPARRRCPAPRPQPVVGVPAASPLLPLPPPRSKRSHTRSQGRLCPGPPLPAGALKAPLKGHGDPQRGGPAAPTPLQPARGQHRGGDPQRCLGGRPDQDCAFSRGLCQPSGAPRPPNPNIPIKDKHENCRKSLRVTNGAGGVALLTPFGFLAGRVGCEPRGVNPSTRDGYSCLLPPKGKCCPAPGLQLCSWSRGSCSQLRGLQDQPMPHRSSPQASPTPPNPSSCAESRRGAALCVPPGSHPTKAGAPRGSTRGSAKSCPWGGTSPGPSICGGLPGWKAARERWPCCCPRAQAFFPLFQRQPWRWHFFCSAWKGPLFGRCWPHGCQAAEDTGFVCFGEKEAEGRPRRALQLPEEEGRWRGSC